MGNAVTGRKGVRVCSHLSLRSPPPGVGEDGADGALGAGVARRRHLRHAAVRLAGVVGLGLCGEDAHAKVSFVELFDANFM